MSTAQHIEAGKKYRYHPFNGEKHNGGIYECLFADARTVLLRVGKTDFTVSGNHEHLSWYKEYVEPKKGTVWVNIYKTGSTTDSRNFSCRQDADEQSNYLGVGNRLACVEVPWTEGQGLV